MSNHLLKTLLGAVAAGVLTQSAVTQRDSFEFVSYAPPQGWAVKRLEEGRAYVRPIGRGVVTFQASRPDSRPAPEAFATQWRTRVEPAVSAPAPMPQILLQGDFTVAVGGGQIRVQDRSIYVSLVTVVGRGRALGIVGMAGDDEALRELIAFFDTITVMSAASGSTVSGPPVSGAVGVVGRWWKDAGADRYYWYEFTDKGSYSYETPLQERRTGTFRVEGNRITLTTSTGSVMTRVVFFDCVGSTVRLEFKDERTGLGDGYWSNPPRPC